jgi:hypothetical protein
MKISMSISAFVATSALRFVVVEGFSSRSLTRPSQQRPFRTTTTTNNRQYTTKSTTIFFSTTTDEAGTETKNNSATNNNNSDFGSAMPEDVDPHDVIGVEPDKLALGIDPNEFLKWIGTYVFTREFLIV